MRLISGSVSVETTGILITTSQASINSFLSAASDQVITWQTAIIKFGSDNFVEYRMEP